MLGNDDHVGQFAGDHPFFVQGLIDGGFHLHAYVTRFLEWRDIGKRELRELQIFFHFSPFTTQFSV